MYELSCFDAMLSLVKAALDADVVELVLLADEEVVARRLPSDAAPIGLNASVATGQPVVLGASSSADVERASVAALAPSLTCAVSVPVSGPNAEPGWIAAGSSQPHSFAARDLDVVRRGADAFEESLDRTVEHQVIEDLGDQLRRSQEELQRTRDRLEVSNRELEQFAYIAAHELLAPMRSVAVYAEVLESLAGTTSDEEAHRRECRTQIRAGLQRMTQQVQHLLELSSAESHADGAPEPVALSNVVSLALETHATQLDAVGASVTVGDLPVVLGAAVPLQSVFANLVANALRYRDKDVPLELTIGSTDTATGPLVMVGDNGPGVLPQHRKRIFELFERASDSEDGSGIGLALSRRILDAFGATIGVDSNNGGGAMFWIQFPRPPLAG